jgi:hypothetical protein
MITIRNRTEGGVMRGLRYSLGLSAIAAGATALALGGSGAAVAGTPPNVVGQTYSSAQSTITGAGFTPVVRSTVGDQLAWPNCIITGTQQHIVPPPQNSNGSAVTQLLVSLNCNAGVATATTPGNSAASPAGQAAIAAAAASATPSAPSG